MSRSAASVSADTLILASSPSSLSTFLLTLSRTLEASSLAVTLIDSSSRAINRPPSRTLRRRHGAAASTARPAPLVHVPFAAIPVMSTLRRGPYGVRRNPPPLAVTVWGSGAVLQPGPATTDTDRLSGPVAGADFDTGRHARRLREAAATIGGELAA